MSDSSDEDDQRKAESTSRMWAESQPGPSSRHPSRQGYCGYCRVLYSNLDQHLSSLRHLDSVRVSSRGSSISSFSSSSRTNVTLLERFLQDVLQHHPHHYNDPRPSHADLQSISIPPKPRIELDEVCLSDQDSQSLGTREHLLSSDDTSCHSVRQKEGNACSLLAEGFTDRLGSPVREQEASAAPSDNIYLPQTKSLPPRTPSPAPVHRKAHRKSNRRKPSDSSSPPRGCGPDLGLCIGEASTCGPDADHSIWSPSDQRPWQSWQKQRREAQKKEVFSSDHRDKLEQTIEEVIQMCCYGISSTPHHQEGTDSLHFSLATSVDTQSEDWDSPVEVVFKPPNSPARASQTEDLRWLMDVKVHMDDQIYSSQLDCALNKRTGGGVRQDQGFWTLPIEQILPVPKYIPEYFRGKTWTQIEQEDEDRVKKLVCQFRRGAFICYFDSESLASIHRRTSTSSYGQRGSSSWYGRRKHTQKGCGDSVLPLLDCEDSSVYLRRRRRGFRLASRCQVVKVSHSTQTVQLVLPTVHQPATEALPPSFTAANGVRERWTPETWRFLPHSYSSIVTPVQAQTSLVYLLCSPPGPAPACSAAAGPSPRRCRKRRRPLDLQVVRVKYRPLNMRFYDPGTNRIIKTPPKGSLRHQGPAHTNPPPSCVRQLFRSLSPDLNADRLVDEKAVRGSRVKGERSADPPFSFLLGTLITQGTNRRGSQTAAPLPSQTKSERGRKKERTDDVTPPKQTRAQTRSQGRRKSTGPSSATPSPSTQRQRRSCRRRK